MNLYSALLTAIYF